MIITGSTHLTKSARIGCYFCSVNKIDDFLLDLEKEITRPQQDDERTAVLVKHCNAKYWDVLHLT